MQVKRKLFQSLGPASANRRSPSRRRDRESRIISLSSSTSLSCNQLLRHPGAVSTDGGSPQVGQCQCVSFSVRIWSSHFFLGLPAVASIQGDGGGGTAPKYGAEGILMSMSGIIMCTCQSTNQSILFQASRPILNIEKKTDRESTQTNMNMYLHKNVDMAL